MHDSNPSPSPGQPATRLADGDPAGAGDALDALLAAPEADRKAAVQSLEDAATADPERFERIVPAVVPYLDDETRAVRLSTAKLLVAVAQSSPAAVLDTVDPLAARLADETEFYYVRARSAEALGYVALEHPETVASPETVAELRVGLSFEDPEVREKLAKALEHVALGDPDRLSHRVPALAEHLGDDHDLVRYHLASALVAVGAADPDRLADAHDALADRLDDETAQVRGRAAEAFGLLARADATVDLPGEALREAADADEPFVADRAAFALDAGEGSGGETPVPDAVGTVEGVRATTAEAADAVVTPDDDGTCPNCGLELPEGGPPMCPRCGVPT